MFRYGCIRMVIPQNAIHNYNNHFYPLLEHFDEQLVHCHIALDMHIRPEFAYNVVRLP